METFAAVWPFRLHLILHHREPQDLGIGSSESTAVGLAVFSPFGTLTRWPDSSPFATATTTKAAFELIDIRPSIAFRPLPDLAIGRSGCVHRPSGAFGEGQIGASVSLAGRGIPAGTGMELNGRDTAAGFNASLLYARYEQRWQTPRQYRPHLS